MNDIKQYYSMAENPANNVVDIYIYGDITSFPYMEGDVSSYNVVRDIESIRAGSINVYINSRGGEVPEGLAIFHALIRHKAAINTFADGFVCSAALLPFLAGDKRIVYPSSALMMHKVWVNTEGDEDELRQTADDIGGINQLTVEAITSRVNIDSAKIEQMMTGKGSWVFPNQALELGFATEIAQTASSSQYNQSIQDELFQMLQSQLKKEVSTDAKIDTTDAVAGLDALESQVDRISQKIDALQTKTAIQQASSGGESLLDLFSGILK